MAATRFAGNDVARGVGGVGVLQDVSVTPRLEYVRRGTKITPFFHAGRVDLGSGTR